MIMIIPHSHVRNHSYLLHTFHDNYSHLFNTGNKRKYDWLVVATISLFPKEITVNSGIVSRDKKYDDRRQILNE